MCAKNYISMTKGLGSPCRVQLAPQDTSSISTTLMITELCFSIIPS